MKKFEKCFFEPVVLDVLDIYCSGCPGDCASNVRCEGDACPLGDTNP